jgi:Carboxypeptidase regulatory-like domain/TonB dependent receptor
MPISTSISELSGCSGSKAALVVRFALLVLAFCWLPSFVNAQFSSSLEGTITDASGAAAPDVAVEIINEATGISSKTRTAGNGYFTVSSLASGRYRVEATKPGFKKSVQFVTLEAARVQSVPIRLTVGEISTQVTVESAPPPVETSEAHISQVTTSQEVLDLPFAGRNVLNVVSQTPGVTGTGLVSDRAGSNDIFNANNSPNVTANGQRGSSNGFYVDDSSVNDAPDQGGAKLSPNPDSVQEVRVSVNNYSAQYGRNSSVLTQIATRSGTNQLHGSLFEYHTNNQLTARNVFQNVANPVTGKVLPVFRRNEFGGSIGFPIRRDHTFFFGSVDALQSSQATTSLATVETPQFTDFMKANYPNRIATNLLTSYPSQVAASGSVRTVADLTASSGLGPCNGTNALGMPCSLPITQQGVLSASAPRTGYQWNARVDHVFGDGTDRIYANYYRMTSTTASISNRPAFTTAPPAETDYANLNWIHTFSPSFSNVAAAGFTRNFGQSPLNHPSVPAITITGLTGFGGGWGPAGFVQNDFHWRDLATINRGSHSFKAGFDIFRDQDNAPFTGPTLRPSFQFANVFDFAADKPFEEDNINFDPRNGGLPFQDYGFRSSTFGFFVQDDWKVQSNFTLNLGLRWDFSGNPSMNVGRLTNLELAPGNTFQQRIADAKVIPVKNMFSDPHIANFAPRVGFAWDPTRTGRLSLRGGVGIFYDRWPNKVWSDNTRGNPPYLAAATASIFNPTGPQPLYVLGTTDEPPFGFALPGVQAGLNPGNGPICCLSSVGGPDQSLKYAYAQNWFFGIQYSPVHSWVIETDYMGSNGKHLYDVIDRNRFAGDLVINKGRLQRLNPYFSSINYGDNSAGSSYHGATVSVRRLFSHGFTFQTSYTFGKAIDYVNAPSPGSASVYAPVIDAYDIRRQRGQSDNDVRNKVSFNFVVNLPALANTPALVRATIGGWEVSSLAILQGGLPATVYTSAPFQAVWNNPACATTVTAACQVIGNTGGDFNADGNNYDLPNAPAFSAANTYSRTAFLNGVFHASDFPSPTLGQEGNLGRNVFRGPGLAQVDLSLLKNFPLPRFVREGARLQFRAEAYNLLNRVNLNTFDTDLSSGTFGFATSTFTPRSLQLAVRIEF